MERDQAIKFMLDLLKLMVQKKGSDLFITVGFPPAMKIDGKMTPVSKQALTPDNAKALNEDGRFALLRNNPKVMFTLIAENGAGSIDLDAAGYAVVDASTALATHLAEVIRHYASELLSRRRVRNRQVLGH